MAFDTNVFINCPFDDQYLNTLLKPMLFVLVKYGLTPRLALEDSDSSQFRLEKIVELIKESKYSIHDLSNIKSNGRNYCRMNMPFELGIDYGIKINSRTQLAEKKFLILEGKLHSYNKAISDIKGFDIKHHDNQTEKIINCIRTWLYETLDIPDMETSKHLWFQFIDFNTNIFDKKEQEYLSKHHYSQQKAQLLAKDYVEKMPVAEYISILKNSSLIP